MGARKLKQNQSKAVRILQRRVRMWETKRHATPAMDIHRVFTLAWQSHRSWGDLYLELVSGAESAGLDLPAFQHLMRAAHPRFSEAQCAALWRAVVSNLSIH